MKIVFIGTVLFSYKSLEKLIALQADIVGVVTKQNSTFNSDFYDLSPLCHQHNIPLLHTEDINSQANLRWIKEKKPDIIFCFGWSNFIKKPLLELTSMGVVGFHPAKLPQNRGRHPLIWALALGLKKSATTFFFMDEGADSGDILSQKDFTITKEDNAQTLYNKVIQISLEQIEEFLPLLKNKIYLRISQDHSKANFWRKRRNNDGIIDFRMSHNAIFNLVRALSHPYVGASLLYKEKEIKIWHVKTEQTTLYSNIESGKIIDIKAKIIHVKCYDGIVTILEHEFKELPEIGEYL